MLSAIVDRRSRGLNTANRNISCPFFIADFADDSEEHFYLTNETIHALSLSSTHEKIKVKRSRGLSLRKELENTGAASENTHTNQKEGSHYLSHSLSVDVIQSVNFSMQD